MFGDISRGGNHGGNTQIKREREKRREKPAPFRLSVVRCFSFFFFSMLVSQLLALPRTRTERTRTEEGERKNKR